MLDRALQVLGALAASAVGVSGAEVGLDRCPAFGKGIAGVDLERQAVVLDRPLQIVGPLAADALFGKRSRLLFCVMAQSSGKASRVSTSSAKP
jgi:hypothetical protein